MWCVLEYSRGSRLPVILYRNLLEREARERAGTLDRRYDCTGRIFFAVPASEVAYSHEPVAANDSGRFCPAA